MTRRRRAGAVALILAVAAALAVGFASGVQPHGQDRTSPVPRAAARPLAIDQDDGPQHIVAPARRLRGRLSFRLDALERARIVAAWLQYDRRRRTLSVRIVSHAARRGVLRVRSPAGWPPARIRLVVRAAARTGVYGCGYGRFARGRWPSGCWRPYSMGSPFNRVLPAAARLAPDSAAVVGRVLGFGRARHLVAGYADTPDDFDHPTYWSRRGDPVFRLHCYEASWGRCPIEGLEIRVPDAARAAAGADGHLTVVDQDSGWEYDLYKVRSKPAGGGLLEFRWGGRTRIDGDGLGSAATAARFGSLAGMVRVAELASGRIDHALFATVRCDAGRFVYPARGMGTSCASVGLPVDGAPPMGARLRLAMTPEEIDALPVPAWKKTILRAMATYGMFVGDTGGGSWGIRMESGSTFTSFGVADPLVAFARTNGWTPYENVRVGRLADGVDWPSRLRVIDPCVTQRTC